MTDKIRAALESHLNAMTPSLTTAWENTSYRPTGSAYQQVNMLYANPDDRVLGCERRYDLGIMQITLNYPLNQGSTPAEDRANAIVSHFKRSTVASSAGQTVMVTNTPAKRVLGSDGSYYRIVLSINYRAEIIG